MQMSERIPKPCEVSCSTRVRSASTEEAQPTKANTPTLFRLIGPSEKAMAMEVKQKKLWSLETGAKKYKTIFFSERCMYIYIQHRHPQYMA